MAVAKRCDRCGKFYDGSEKAFKFTDPEGVEHEINSFRIGDWDSKAKKWRSIASGYDLCYNCGSALFDFMTSGDNNQVKFKKTADRSTQYQKKETVEDEQVAFASTQEDNDDGK